MPKGVRIDAEALKERRLEARRLMDEGVSQAEVARQLKISRQSVSRWAKMPKSRLGKTSSQGRKSVLSPAQRTRLVAILLKGPQACGFTGQLWTVPRVRQVLVLKFGLAFSAVHVWRILGQLKFSPQRPQTRARERNEQAIVDWKTKQWPRIKKKLTERAARSSLSTKAV